jgi:hypothetical protein
MCHLSWISCQSCFYGQPPQGAFLLEDCFNVVTISNTFKNLIPGTYTTRPCFMPDCFMPFYFNAPYQYTPVLNLNPLIFSLMPFGWFNCICLSLFLREYHFLLMPFWFIPTFSGKQLVYKTRPWFLQRSLSEMGCLVIENSCFYQTQLSKCLPVLSPEENRSSFQYSVFCLEY